MSIFHHTRYHFESRLDFIFVFMDLERVLPNGLSRVWVQYPICILLIPSVKGIRERPRHDSCRIGDCRATVSGSKYFTAVPRRWMHSAACLARGRAPRLCWCSGVSCWSPRAPCSASSRRRTAYAHRGRLASLCSFPEDRTIAVGSQP